eukprot:g1060.t1
MIDDMKSPLLDEEKGQGEGGGDIDIGDVPKSGKRWILLGVLFYNTLVAGLLYLGFSVIEDDAREHFGVSRLAINSMAVLGTSMPVLTYPIASRVVDTRGIRCCHLIGTSIVCLGSWIRVLGHRQYWICFGGQAILSVGMSFLNSLPAALSSRWFPQKERSLATSLAMLAFLTGMAVGQGIASFFKNAITLYLLVQAGMLTIPIPFVFFLVNDSPKKILTAGTTASPLDETKPARSVFAAMIQVLRTPSVRWLCVAAAFGIGTFNTILALVDEVVPPSIKGHESLLSGACFFLPGIIGTVILALYCDRSRQYLTIARFTCSVIIVAFAVLCYGWNQNIAPIVYPAFAVIGSVGLGLIPLCVELGIELSFDPGQRLEGAVNAVVQTSINLGSMLSLYAFDPGNLGIADKNAIFLWYGIIAGALCCMLRIKPEYKRLEHEKQQASLRNNAAVDEKA